VTWNEITPPRKNVRDSLLDFPYASQAQLTMTHMAIVNILFEKYLSAFARVKI
jgi:hypothetical protein